MSKNWTRNLPVIFSFLACVGVVGTAVATAIAAPKAQEKIKKDSRKNHDGDPYAYTFKEAVKSSWKDYAIPAGVGTATIACIILSNRLSAKQFASLVAASATVGKTFTKYRERVREVYGEQADKDIMRDITIYQTDPDNPLVSIEPFLGTPMSIDFEGFDEEKVLCYDSFSERYFECQPLKLAQAVYHFNHNFSTGYWGAPSLNDLYDFLGLPKTKVGDDIGWSYADWDSSWVNFYIDRQLIEKDGLVCYYFGAFEPPIAGFDKDL